MSLHFFAISALQAQAAQDELNAVRAAHRVHARNTPMDQMPHPVRQRFAYARPKPPNRKAPGAPVGNPAAAGRRTPSGLPTFSACLP